MFFDQGPVSVPILVEPARPPLPIISSFLLLLTCNCAKGVVETSSDPAENLQLRPLVNPIVGFCVNLSQRALIGLLYVPLKLTLNLVEDTCAILEFKWSAGAFGHELWLGRLTRCRVALSKPFSDCSGRFRALPFEFASQLAGRLRS